MLVADYAPAMIDGAGVRPFEGGAPLSRGAEIITLTGREAVGIDRAGRPRPLGPARFAVNRLRRLSKRVRPDGAEDVFDELAVATRTARVLVLESPAERRDGRLGKAVRVNRKGLGSIVLGALPGDGVRAFDSLERQGFVIDQLTDWFDRTLDGRPVTTAAPAGHAT